MDLINKGLEANPQSPLLVLNYLQNFQKLNKNADFYEIMIKSFQSFDLLDVDLNIFKVFLDFKFSDFHNYKQSFMRDEIKTLIL